jgi:hypothetical protein
MVPMFLSHSMQSSAVIVLVDNPFLQIKEPQKKIPLNLIEQLLLCLLVYISVLSHLLCIQVLLLHDIKPYKTI